MTTRTAKPEPRTWSAFVAELAAHKPLANDIERWRTRSRQAVANSRIVVAATFLVAPAAYHGALLVWNSGELNPLLLMVWGTLVFLTFASGVIAAASVLTGAVFMGAAGAEARAQRWHAEETPTAHDLYFVAAFCERLPPVAAIVRRWVDDVGEISATEVKLLRRGKHWHENPHLALTDAELMDDAKQQLTKVLTERHPADVLEERQGPVSA